MLTSDGWLILYHGVEDNGGVGIYRTFWALLDEADPLKIVRIEDSTPLLEADPQLTSSISHQIYLHDVVFTTGIAEHGDDFILASGELDLACRITTISKKYFSRRCVFCRDKSASLHLSPLDRVTNRIELCHILDVVMTVPKMSVFWG